MFEQLYELNIPSFYEIKQSSFNFIDESPNIYRYEKKFDEVIDINRIPLLKQLNFKWKSYRYFKKSNVQGTLHTDLDDPNDYNKECEWAINWIFDGGGKLNFYKFENCIPIGMTSGAQNLNIAKTPKFRAKKIIPDYSYNTIQNKVYLINTSLPHIAFGYNNRRVFSLRTDDRTIKWEEVVNKFKDLIIF